MQGVSSIEARFFNVLQKENTMNKENTELVGKLYALRAGLSAASQKRDNVDEIKQTYDKEISKENESIRKLQDIVDTTKQQIKSYSLESSLNRSSNIKMLEDSQRRLEDKYQDNLQWLIINIIFLFAYIVATIVFIILYQISKQTRGWGDDWLIGFAYFFIALTFFSPLCIFPKSTNSVLKSLFRFYKIYYLWHETKLSKQKLKEHEKTKNIYLYSNDNGLNQYHKKLDSAKSEIPLHSQSIEKLNQQCKVHIAPYVAVVEELNKALVAEFKDVLDPRDWQNVDLIIFYFETGRADTLKEALHLVDNERHTERIVNAIHSASAYVAQTIRSGMYELRNTMVQCFSAVSTQLNAIGTQQRTAYAAMYNQMQQINSSVENMSLQMSNISADIKNNFDFNRALAEKSATSSDKLMADLNYMRGLAEEAEFRRRYS